jgi:putative PIN family toxin of toxin-antitoxin system
MTYFAVLDTNVLVSAMLKSDSIPGAVLELALGGNITPLFNEAILDEYQEVLSRPKFHFNDRIVKAVIQTIVQHGIQVDAEKLDVSDFPDPDDIVFYEVVMEERKSEEAFLITGNLRHYPVKSFVVTPKQMLDLILTNQSDK